MFVVDRRRIVVGEVVVLGWRARLPVVPRPLGINRIHPAELFDAFAVWILGFSHRVSWTDSISKPSCHALRRAGGWEATTDSFAMAGGVKSCSSAIIDVVS